MNTKNQAFRLCFQKTWESIVELLLQSKLLRLTFIARTSQFVAEQANLLYQCLSQKTHKQTTMTRINQLEINKFFAITTVTSIARLPAINEYWLSSQRNDLHAIVQLNYHTEQIQAFAKVLASGGYTEKFQVTKLDMRHFSNMEIFLNKYTKIFP